MSDPRVTVLMPVYNAAPYLQEAIGSILGQSYRDFNFLIIDDGSTDGSSDIISSFRDPRITVMRNERNLGWIASLARGMEQARSELVARMDADDISLPERLAKQVRFLDENPKVGVCGTWYRYFGAGRKKTVRYPTDPAELSSGLLFNSRLGHPTVMLRRELFRAAGLTYDASFSHAEDYDLWARAADICDLANIGEVLLHYRIHPHQVTKTFASERVQAAGEIRARQIRKLGIEPSPQELAVHQAISDCEFHGSAELFEQAGAWLSKLKEANDVRKIYAEPAFSRVLVDVWLTACKKAIDQGVWSPCMVRPAILKKTGLGWGYVIRSVLRHLGIT